MTAEPSPPPLLPLGTRRRAVALTAAAFLGYVTLTVLALRMGTPRAPDGTLRGLASLGLLLTFAFGYRLYFPGLLGLPGTAARDLDERQLGVVTRARTRAYLVLSLLFVFGTIYLDLAGARGWPFPTGRAWALIAVSVSLLAGALPAALLAWTEPDPPGEDVTDALPAA